MAFLYVPSKSRVSIGSLPCTTKTGSLKLALKLRFLPAPYVPFATPAVTLSKSGAIPSTMMAPCPRSEFEAPGFGRVQT